MNFAEIEKLWRSPRNQPSPGELEKMKMKFTNELRRIRRGQLLFLAVITGWSLVVAGMLFRHLVAPQPGTSPVDLRREWAILPFFILAIAGWGWMVRSDWRHRRLFPIGSASLQQTLAALLDENRMQMRRYRLGAYFFAASVPLLGLVVYQLRQVGKAGDEILVPAMILYPLYVCVLLAGGRWHYVKKLQPRAQDLESRLLEYEQDSGAAKG